METQSLDATDHELEQKGKWTHPSRFGEQMKRLASKMGRKSTARFNVMPTIVRVSHMTRAVRPDLFRYSPVTMTLGLYNRGDLNKPTECEKLRIRVVLEFLDVINDFRRKDGRELLDWDELGRRVVPNPSRVRLLYEDVPEELTDEDVRYLLTIDAVYLQCLLRCISSGSPFSPIPAIIRMDIDVLIKRGTMQDIMLMENQIPVVLIQNALAVELESTHPVGNWVPENLTSNLDEIEEDKDSPAAADLPPEHQTPGVGFNMQKYEPPIDLICAKEYKSVISRLLRSVIPLFLMVSGLQHFDYYLSLTDDELASCDHLLHCLYKVVCFRPQGAREVEDSAIRDHNINITNDELRDPGPSRGFCFQPLSSFLQQVLTAFPVVAAFGAKPKQYSNSNTTPADPFSFHMIPTASKLKKAGILVTGSDAGTIWEYKMVEGLFYDTLYIPKLTLWLDTLKSLRNLIMIEMRPPAGPPQNPLLEYILLMDTLVDTREDVSILCDRGRKSVMINTLGDDAVVVDLINHIVQGTYRHSEDSPAFKKVCLDIQKCYRKHKKRMFWEFVETYLNKPWKVASLLAAIVLLVLTFLQTVYSMLSYYPSGR